MHRSYLLKSYIAGIFSCILLLSCDASRDNPLDPSSPDNIYIILEGTVKTEALPRTAIPVVEVFWKGSNVIVNTDDSGKFSILDINRRDDWIIFSKNGYANDSVFVEWNGNKRVEVEAFLNADPVLEEFIVSSKVINNEPAIQTAYCEIYASLSDAENDVDHVYVSNPDLNFISELYYNPSAKSYYNIFTESDLGVSIDEAIGNNFHIIAEDNSGKIFDIGEERIRRVITDEVNFEAPKNNIETSNPITLQWNVFEPGFNFTYSIQVFSVDLPPVLMWEKDGIPADSTNCIVTANLPSGEHYWVIWAVDEYNNKTRSKPATFTIR